MFIMVCSRDAGKKDIDMYAFGVSTAGTTADRHIIKRPQGRLDLLDLLFRHAGPKVLDNVIYIHADPIGHLFLPIPATHADVAGVFARRPRRRVIEEMRLLVGVLRNVDWSPFVQTVSEPILLVLYGFATCAGDVYLRFHK